MHHAQKVGHGHGSGWDCHNLEIWDQIGYIFVGVKVGHGSGLSEVGYLVSGWFQIH